MAASWRRTRIQRWRQRCSTESCSVTLSCQIATASSCSSSSLLLLLQKEKWGEEGLLKILQLLFSMAHTSCWSTTEEESRPTASS